MTDDELARIEENVVASGRSVPAAASLDLFDEIHRLRAERDGLREFVVDLLAFSRDELTRLATSDPLPGVSGDLQLYARDVLMRVWRHDRDGWAAIKDRLEEP